MRSIGIPEILVILLIAVIYILPLWRIAARMGYPGGLGILAFLPGVNLVLAYYVAFSEWPRLRGMRS